MRVPAIVQAGDPGFPSAVAPAAENHHHPASGKELAASSNGIPAMGATLILTGHRAAHKSESSNGARWRLRVIWFSV